MTCPMTQTSPVLQLGSKLCGLDPTWHRPTTSRLPVLLAPERPLGPALTPGTHSLQRLTMAVFFLTLRVLLADSEGGSSSQDKL